jgi:hypothetical protein
VKNFLLDKHIVNNGKALFTTLFEKLFVTQFEMSLMTLFAWVLKNTFLCDPQYNINIPLHGGLVFDNKNMVPFFLI